jgi:ABC-2 type transport system ATP-binding protein
VSRGGGCVLRALDLRRDFDGTTAVDGVSFEVPTGSVFALLGPNGAGKTTTIRMLTCLIRPTSGTAQFDGLDVTRPGDAMEIRKQVGLLPETPGLYERLSAYKNLDFHARLYGMPKAARASSIERLLRMLGVWEKRDDAVTTFSKGMRQKIAIARAVVHGPKYLFLDEPTSSLDPEAAHTVREFILEQRAGGATVFLNTHNLAEAERVATHIGILNRSLRAVGTPDGLRARAGAAQLVTRVEGPAARFLPALGAAGFNDASADGSTLRVAAVDPSAAGPLISGALVGAGARLVEMRHERPPLEDAYLALVGAH